MGYGLRRNASIFNDGLIFLRYAYRQHSSIENGEDKRVDRQAERQRNGGEFAGNHRIIGVAQKPIRAARDQCLAGNGDDPDRPAPPERNQDPKSRDLQQDNDHQEKRNDRAIVTEHPQPDDPGGVEENDQKEVRPAELNAAGGEETPFVLLGPPKLGNPLCGDERKQRRAPTERHHNSAATK